MSNFIVIKNELAANTALYGTMTDQQVADELNAVSKSQNRTSMTRQEVLAQIDPSDMTTLVGDNAVKVFGILSDTIDPFDPVIVRVFVDAFGGGTQTIQNLQAARTELVSRASQIGAGHVRVAHVNNARAI